MTSLFSVVVPEATVNYVTTPSFETNVSNWAAVGGGAIIQTTHVGSQAWGLYSARITSGAVDQDGAQYAQALTGPTGTYSVSFWISGQGVYTNGIRLKVLDGASSRYNALIPSVPTTPFRVSVENITLTQAATFHIHLLTEGATNRVIYVDGLQVENKAYVTDYCDGDQPGCSWDGTAYASTSRRSAMYRGAGRERNFEDVYSVRVIAYTGTGTPPLKQATVQAAPNLRPSYQQTVTQPRIIQMTCELHTTTLAGLHTLRKTFLDAIKPDLVYPPQPFVLRYNGTGTTYEIECILDGGYEQVVSPRNQGATKLEIFTLRLIAYDPNWRALYESATLLDMQDTATARLVAGQVNGLWDVLGPPGAPGTAVYTSVRAAIVGPDGCLYIGGVFQNFDNQANCDYVAKGTYDPVAGTWSWSPLGTGMQTDGSHTGWVMGLCFDASGNLWATGDFLTAGGVANTARVAYWTGSAWTSPDGGAGPDAAGFALACGQDGTIYLGGAFANISGNARAHVASFASGASSWSAMGSGTDNDVYTIAVGLDAKVWVGGIFGHVNGAAIVASAIGYWTPSTSTWAAVGDITAPFVYALAIGLDGSVYAGGSFTSAGGITVANIARYTGASFTPLGSGLDAQCRALAVHPITGILYASGQFTTAGGLAIADRVAKWNGTAWAQLDIDLPGTPLVYAMTATRSGQLFFGFDTTGTATYAGNATVTAGGTAPTAPRLVVIRNGSATTVQALTNLTTSRVVLLNHALAPLDKVTFDLERVSVTSKFSGPLVGRILPNSDQGTWTLLPGDNTIAALATGANPIGYLVWRNKWLSADGG